MRTTSTVLRAMAAALRADAERLDALADEADAPPPPVPDDTPPRRGPENHLSIDEAADALGIGRSRIYELLAAGELVSLRLGRRRWVTRASVEALLERAAQAS